MTVRVLVLGASGRLGGMLRRHWRHADGIDALWQIRAPCDLPDTLVFSPLSETPSIDPVTVVLGLAGVTPGSGAALSLNTDLALAALRLGADLGARRVFLSSSAGVYGRADHPLTEKDPTQPASPYGAAKLAMEKAVLTKAATLKIDTTVLRIGNVAGADALLGQAGMHRALDRFADGRGPRRSYASPIAFAHMMAALVRLAAQGTMLPPILNLAQPGSVAMEDLLCFADIPFDWRPAPFDALPDVTLDVTQLGALIALTKAEAECIVAEWRADMRTV